MHLLKYDISELLKDYDNYSLSITDIKRIKPLVSLIKQHQLRFKYFITISPYDFIPDTDKGRDIIRNRIRYLKKKIRKFYKADIRLWGFIETHSESSKHSGGLHIHILIEDAPGERWKNPSNSMINFLNDIDAEAIFSSRYGVEIPENTKINLLKKVCRLCNTTPTGNKGLDIREIHDTQKLAGYCTKQLKSWDDADNKIDFENSDFMNQLHLNKNEKAVIPYRLKTIFA